MYSKKLLNSFGSLSIPAKRWNKRKEKTIKPQPSVFIYLVAFGFWWNFLLILI